MSNIDLKDAIFNSETAFQKQLSALHNSLATHQVSEYEVHVWLHWNEQAAQFARQVDQHSATLFQSENWLQNWYDSFASEARNEPLIVAIKSRKTRELTMMLPLCKHQENGLDTISFADFGVADYNAPLIQADFNPDEREIRQLMRDICKALPPADLLKLEKIPELIQGRKNPLAMLPGMQTSNLCHYGIEITSSWEDYMNGLKRSFRKDQRRRWRVLEKKGDVSFKVCRDPQEVLALYNTLLKQQQARLDGLDLPYLLADNRMKEFYQKIIEQGCTDGSIIFTALLVDQQPVATLCGLGDGHSYAMTLSGYEMGEWRKCSPGRLLTERTMQHLHENGYSYFDFTIGDEPYKKYFAMEQGALREYSRPLSLKALPRHYWMKLKASTRDTKIVVTLKEYISV